MFLLILARTLKTGQSNPNFTFHNVSINTVNRGCAEYVEHIFTFHNVSINTPGFTGWVNTPVSLHSTMFLLIRRPCSEWRWMVISLHSTMFLLIREPLRNIISAPTFFTFHNVSINTVGTIKTGQNDPDFTFHNVSINTQYPRGFHIRSSLYIPQCFY